MENVQNKNPLPTSSTQPLIPAHVPSSEPDERAAADRVEADILLVHDEVTTDVRLDVDAVVGMVIWACSAMAPYADAIAAMPGLDVARFRKLSDFARALSYWQQRSRVSNAMPVGLGELVDEGMALRERTIHDLEAHVKHGHLDAKLLEAFGGQMSHRKVGADLEALSILVHENWSRLAGHTLITLESMDQAYRLGARIIDACAARDLAPATVARAAQMRDRAYTLVLNTYNDARVAMQYLRRVEGDADKFAPSLYSTRRAPKRGGEDAGEAPVEDTATAPGVRTAPSLGLFGGTSSLIVPDTDVTPARG